MFSVKMIQSVCALLLIPVLTNAHVTLDQKTATPGAHAKLVLRVPHGCDGSPTTKITVQLPKGSALVKPQVHAGWKIKTKKAKLETPIKAHGKDITEAVSEITWEGGPLSDEYMDEFGMSLKLPDTPGEKLVFPVIQTCKKGVSNWTEVPAPGHEHHAAFPAPFLMLDAKASDAHTH